MLTRIPSQLPSLGHILADLGSPTPAQLGRALDVPARTASAWIAERRAPPLAAMHSLFWVSRWGQSVAHCDAVNELAIWRALASARADEAQRLRAELARVLALGDFGAANSPTLAVAPACSATGARWRPALRDPLPQARELAHDQRHNHGRRQG